MILLPTWPQNATEDTLCLPPIPPFHLSGKAPALACGSGRVFGPVRPIWLVFHSSDPSCMVYCFESLLFKKFYRLFVVTVAICKTQIPEKNKSASGPHSERMCPFLYLMLI